MYHLSASDMWALPINTAPFRSGDSHFNIDFALPILHCTCVLFQPPSCNVSFSCTLVIEVCRTSLSSGNYRKEAPSMVDRFFVRTDDDRSIRNTASLYEAVAWYWSQGGLSIPEFGNLYRLWISDNLSRNQSSELKLSWHQGRLITWGQLNTG